MIKINLQAHLPPGVSIVVPMTVNGLETGLLVDTGAVVTILSTDLFYSILEENRPSLRELADNVHLEVADAGQLKVVGVATVTMNMGSQKFDWDVYVAPIKDAVLLGMDFLYGILNMNINLMKW